MRARGDETRTLRLAAMVIALTLAASAVPAAAVAKSKKGTATTASGTVAFASSLTQTGQAGCPKKTHATGGGYAVASVHDPASNSGIRTLNQVSYPSGRNGWSAVGGAYAAPVASGSFTTFARCEKNSAGKLAGILSGTSTINPSSGTNSVLTCSPGTHAINGGYATVRPFSAADAASSRLVFLQSRRTSSRSWTISAANISTTVASTLAVYVVCERNAKGHPISESSSTATIINDHRTASDASCAKKQHVVSGGFLVTPAIFPGTVPAVGIDETEPVGGRSWHVGLYEFVGLATPPGASLTTTAYCKKSS